jgi:hypothetical protein
MKTIDQFPTIADQVLFELDTTDSNDCLITPYKVDKVTIYFIERGFSGDSFSSYDVDQTDPSLLSALQEAKQLVCDDPSETNVANLQKAQANVDQSQIFQTVYYKQSVSVANFGYESLSESYPAWLDPDEVPPEERDEVIENNTLTQVLDIQKNPIPGKFNLLWTPSGMREGDYFICWTWQPNLAGDTISNHFLFRLYGSSQVTTSLPTHFTDPKKYETLMDRYLPEICKRKICDADLTPQVVRGLNNSVAAGFTVLEDKTNQILDTIDANVTHEYLLPYLANLFNLKLQTNDPALWRRQIKQAIKLFKKKGTRSGLEETLSESGVTLKQLTRLWQVISPYSWQEMFDVAEDGQTEFTLLRSAIDVVAVYYREGGETTAERLAHEWIVLPTTVVTLSDDVTLFWVGDPLYKGDSIRIIYNLILPDDQDKEDYILSLPLADIRDERAQCYPPFNWNVRIIEENDALFDWIIPNKYPPQDALIYGKIRTEFPYSENVYNMEEYNGSTRESTDPCNIDKKFLDPCKDCPGSEFNIEVEVEELSNDRLLDVEEIIRESVPFHTVLHSIVFNGSINEFMKPPIEEITAVILVEGEEVLLAGESQSMFNRVVRTPDAMDIMLRDMLASVDPDASVFGVNGLAQSTDVLIVSPGSFVDDETTKGQIVKFNTYSIDTTSVSGLPANNSNLLEIYAPHTLAGEYSIDKPASFHAIVSAGSYLEPVDQSQFTFRLSNKQLSATVNIEQCNAFVFSDIVNDFSDLNIVSQWDVDHNDSTLPVTEITIDSYGTYPILDILPNGKLVLEDDGTLPTTDQTNLVWTILGVSGVDGVLTVLHRGAIDFTAVGMDDVRNIFSDLDYVLYDGTQYRVCGFVADSTVKVYVDDYTDGDHGGVSVTVYRRLIDDAIGQFTYQGFTLDTSPVNYEVNLPIENGVNAAHLPSGPPNEGGLDALEDNVFKENYLVKIDGDYYAISEIDGTIMTLVGPYQEWTKTGTNVTFDIYKFVKNSVDVPPRNDAGLPGHDFDSIDRGGGPVIDYEIDPILEARLLNLAKRNSNQMVDVLQQVENINYTIEYDDGSVKQGEV